MLTGAPPFSNQQKPEVAFHVVLEGRRPSQPKNPESLGITNEIWNLLEVCWAKNASSRPKVGQVVGRLNEVAKHWTADPTAFLLASKAGVQEVLSMEPEKAQKIADDIDEVRKYVRVRSNQSADPNRQALDRVGVGKNTRKYLRCLQKLCGASGVLPQSFSLAGELEEVDKAPFSGGGYSYVYRATYEGKRVAVKVLKADTLSGDPKLTRMVRILFTHLTSIPSHLVE